MKVVLFCGGLGMRLREVSESIPKPMIHIGYRPILWHVMKYYAYHGHKDFILCLGYGADVIKNYFLDYNECISNDFTLSRGGKTLQLFNSDIDEWNITFAETGASSNIGQRLKAVEKYLDGEDVFLANYSDGLTDLPLKDQIDHFNREQKVASFLCVKPNLSVHFVNLTSQGLVESIKDVSSSDIHINGGYFVFRKEIFQYIKDGEELLHQPFQRMVERKQLLAYKHDGFWAAMDTFKDKQMLDEMYARGHAPWQVWNDSPKAPPVPRVTKSRSDPAAGHATVKG
ncbi:MAG TPA: sugar phosphate nucleotidyltransferase [Candidatus Saccharimonadales bacterium]|nr:sugar phosphate nucleotidyltransferase [Candidatus Saccharimonadales bacterium]